MVAFLLLFAVFNYTESSGGRGVGRFPRRLFTLPVTSLRLVAVPLLAGIASIELLYLLWMEPLSRGGSASAPFVAVLLAAFVVFYLSALWTLERAGSLRLFILGLIAIALFAVGVLPSFPPSPPPPVAFGDRPGRRSSRALPWSRFCWRGATSLDFGPAVDAAHIEPSLSSSRIAEAAPSADGERSRTPRPRTSGSSGGRQESCCRHSSGPSCSSSSCRCRGWCEAMPRTRFVFCSQSLAAPVVLAVPVGMAFSKPTFWSEDLAVPAFVAVRPLSSEDLVATKVKVAAASAVLSWVVVLAVSGGVAVLVGQSRCP